MVVLVDSVPAEFMVKLLYEYFKQVDGSKSIMGEFPHTGVKPTRDTRNVQKERI